MSAIDTQAISSLSTSDEFPIYPSQCVKMTPVAASAIDGYWGNWTNFKIFYQVMVEVAGNLVVEMKDGSIFYRPDISPGEMVLVGGGKRILTNANAKAQDGSDVAVSTTATGIWVYGGK